MAAKTRYFVLTAAGILTAGLTTGLVASYLGGLPVALSRQAGPEDLAFVPQEAVVVGYANVQEVMASELRQRFRRMESDHPDSPDRRDFEQKTGVNVERDVDAVVAALLPSAAGDGKDGQPLMLARGRFDQVRIEGLVREHGGEASDYQGVRVIVHADGDKTMALGFLAPGVIAVGSRDGVQGAIDAKRSGRNVMSNTEIMRLVGELDGNNAWAVGRFDAMASSTGLPADLQERMPMLSWFSVAGHLNGGITGSLMAEAKDDEAAKNLRDMLRGAMAVVKLQADGRPEMRSLVDSLQLGGEGRTVAVAFSVPVEAFDALEALSSKRRRPAEVR
ncbi:MAG: hypothetical protein KA371_02335 [Acidobacteria bacterium]|jgi:hypothetical protein|nr:hypothetical protein [Acidobacteriota bacterium]